MRNKPWEAKQPQIAKLKHRKKRYHIRQKFTELEPWFDLYGYVETKELTRSEVTLYLLDPQYQLFEVINDRECKPVIDKMG